MTTLDPTANYHGGADTSVAAWQAVPAEVRAKARATVLRCIAAAPGGLTCANVEALTGISHQSASARITELVADGMIIDSGLRRPTPSGRLARVYFVQEGATA